VLSPQSGSVTFSRAELAGVLSAVRAVLDVAPGLPPGPLKDAEAKLQDALTAMGPVDSGGIMGGSTNRPGGASNAPGPAQEVES
jgi:hypothetical protein